MLRFYSSTNRLYKAKSMRKPKRRFTVSVESLEGRLLMSATPQFTVKDLGAISAFGNVGGINSLGQVVGTIQTVKYAPFQVGLSGVDGSPLKPIVNDPDPNDPNYQFYAPFGFDTAYGLSVNDSGQISGTATLSSSNTANRFVYSNGDAHLIPNTDEARFLGAKIINNLGNTVGTLTSTTNVHGFLYDGAIHDIGTLGGTYSVALSLNDSNVVVGLSETTSGQTHAFFYDGVMHDMGTLGGTYSFADGIDNNGRVFGVSYASDGTEHGFVSDPNEGTLHDLGSTFRPVTSNDHNQIVGYGFDENHTYTFPAWYDGKTTKNVNDLIPQNSGFTISYLRGINNYDQMAAEGVNEFGRRALLLTPVPQAPTITWSNPADIVYGTPITSTQLNATADVPGTFTYNVAEGTVLHAGAAQSLVATFTPTDTSLYTTATAEAFLNVLPAPLTVTANNVTKVQGQVNPTFTGTITGLVNGDTDVATYSTTATTSSSAGTYDIIPFLIDSNYAITFVSGTLTVTPKPAGYRPPPSPW